MYTWEVGYKLIYFKGELLDPNLDQCLHCSTVFLLKSRKKMRKGENWSENGHLDAGQNTKHLWVFTFD